MKRLLSLVILIACYSGSSFAQKNVWRWQNPVPQGNYLRAVQMVSQNIIYLCGDNVSFASSTDGGESWNAASNILGKKGNLYGLNFLNSNYGMCCGDSGRVLRTIDGGATWQLMPTKIKTKLNGILLVDASHAITISQEGATLLSKDSGATWATLPSEQVLPLFSIRMLRPDFITITGYGGTVLKSVDSGASWKRFDIRIGNSFYGAYFSDDNNGTVVGELGSIIHTTDGGSTWISQHLADSSALSVTLNGIDGKDANTIAAVGDHGTLLFTTDAGTSWKQSFLGAATPIKGVSFSDKLTGTAIGSGGVILRASDGGATWEFIPNKPTTDLLRAVSFPRGDTSHGIAVGNNGVIMRTSDGGKSWILSQSGTGYALYSASFMGRDTLDAIVVGDRGTIIKTTDGGETWTPKSAGTLATLFSVSFSTTMRGIIAGDSGRILRTESSGEYWTRFFTTPVTESEYFVGVSYPDSLHAYICGQYNVYKSTDGGFHWLPIHNGRGASISFGDSVHGGYTYGDRLGAGFTRCTSDGGLTFDSTYPGQGLARTIGCICFSDPQHVTVVANNGLIAHSTDGGKTWYTQQSNTVNNLLGVSFGTVKAGNAVGVHGNIMRVTSTDIPFDIVRNPSPSSAKKITISSYPNPFTKSTTIEYILPTPALTTIEIFSIDGKHIATLASEFQTSGDHSIHYDASGFTSGTYFVRISSDGISEQKELILSR